jgi:hypothetical protein
MNMRRVGCADIPMPHQILQAAGNEMESGSLVERNVAGDLPKA